MKNKIWAMSLSMPLAGNKLNGELAAIVEMYIVVGESDPFDAVN
jgi:hypothetical protein